MSLIKEYYSDTQLENKNIHLKSELNSLKSAYINKLEKVEIPTRKIEDWKYTNLNNILNNKYQLQQPNCPTASFVNRPNFINLNFFNGEFDPSTSDNIEIEITRMR